MATAVPKFQSGFRLINGDDLNKLVTYVNDEIGDGTPQPGTFTTLSATGPAMLSGGVVRSGPPAYSTVPIGSVAYASFGNDTVLVAGTTYWSQLVIDRNFTITNINVLQGTIAGTDKWIAALYAAAGGAALATSALAGVTVTTSNIPLVLPLIAPLAVVGPGLYWIGLQSNGTTDKARMIAASTFINQLTKSATGSFATVPSLTVPTTFTANVGPIAYVN